MKKKKHFNMNADTYALYASLDAQIRNLEEQKDILKAEIINEMTTQGVSTATNTVGKFTISQLKSWVYTDAVEKLADKLKATKAKEESTGDATFIEKPSLRYTRIIL